MELPIFMARQAVEAHRAGRLKQAEKLYRAVLVRTPNNPDALHLLGVVLHQSSQTTASVSFLERAVALRPFDPEIRNNLGVSLNALGRFAEASIQLECAVGLDGSVASALSNLGVAYRGLRRLGEAKASLERSLALDDHAHVHSNLGLVHLDLRDAKAAAACFERAIAIDPAWAQAHVHRGLALQGLARLPDAVACFDTALALDPSHGQALGQRCHLRRMLCDWRSLDADRAALSGRTGAWRSSDPPSPFTVLALTDNPEVQLWRARDYARSFGAGPHPASPRPTVGHVTGRIRIAYLSPDFRRHPVAALLVDVLALHDRARFEITVLSYGPDDGSGLRRCVEAAADHFLDVAGWSDAAVAAHLRTSGIHVAVDLAGFTTLSRPAILAGRPAPIQVSYLGYPGTSGSDWIDYIVGDTFLAQGNALLACLSEAMVILPGSFQANSRRPAPPSVAPSRTSQGLPEDGFVFCSFSSSYKFTPDLFGTWLRLLRAVPSSVLWLLAEHEATKANLRQAAEVGGVAPDRIVFAPRVSYEDHLARLPLADLFLDTFPYNSGATAADALWMGVPLLTLSGAAYASRMAGSLLWALGLTDLITADLAAYESRALRLATEPALLGKARDVLAGRLRDSPDLFDPAAFARTLEAGFLAMVDRKVKGLRASHLHVYA